MVNIFGYISEISESKYMVPSTGKNKTKMRLDQLGLSLLRGLHVCFVSFEGLTHAKQGKVADWKHQTPIQPKHEATSRSSCRRCLSSASSACSTCPHLQSYRILKQCTRWLPKTGSKMTLKFRYVMYLPPVCIPSCCIFSPDQGRATATISSRFGCMELSCHHQRTLSPMLQCCHFQHRGLGRYTMLAPH